MHTSLPEKRIEPWASWEPCGGEQGAAAFKRLASQLPGFFADARLVSSRQSRLSFYKPTG